MMLPGKGVRGEVSGSKIWMPRDVSSSEKSPARIAAVGTVLTKVTPRSW
jgi:hypothetical protein